MFTGTYENSIDSKNRMIIPAKYRNQLGGECMLSRPLHLHLYDGGLGDARRQAQRA